MAFIFLCKCVFVYYGEHRLFFIFGKLEIQLKSFVYVYREKEKYCMQTIWKNIKFSMITDQKIFMIEIEFILMNIENGQYQHNKHKDAIKIEKKLLLFHKR